jgi:hypothetical protein
LLRGFVARSGFEPETSGLWIYLKYTNLLNISIKNVHFCLKMNKTGHYVWGIPHAENNGIERAFPKGLFNLG